jgi:L-threonylcarbamoyladenylate synthase
VIRQADAAGISRAAALLRAGQVVAFPTETVYGLGADAFSETAVAEIYRLKNRPSWNPLIVHVADVTQARTLARTWPDLANELAAQFWPGPLSLVVERAEHLPQFGPETKTIAIRVPAHEVARTLIDASGLALAAPSANRSESISPTTAQHVLSSLPDVPMVLDGGPTRWGIESTVLDLTRETPRLLRPGALPLREIRQVTESIELPDEVVDGELRSSPGMSRRHYAPRARLILVDDIDAARVTSGCGVLTYETEDVLDAEILSQNPREYAADLYAALHRLDDRGVDTIVVKRPPDTEEWMAVRDRLARAAH